MHETMGGEAKKKWEDVMNNEWVHSWKVSWSSNSTIKQLSVLMVDHLLKSDYYSLSKTEKKDLRCTSGLSAVVKLRVTKWETLQAKIETTVWRPDI